MSECSHAGLGDQTTRISHDCFDEREKGTFECSMMKGENKQQ